MAEYDIKLQKKMEKAVEYREDKQMLMTFNGPLKEYMLENSDVRLAREAYKNAERQKRIDKQNPSRQKIAVVDDSIQGSALKGLVESQSENEEN